MTLCLHAHLLSRLARQPDPSPEEVYDLVDHVCRDFRYRPALGAALMLRAIYSAAETGSLPLGLHTELDLLLKTFRCRCPAARVADIPRDQRRAYVAAHHGPMQRRLRELIRVMLSPGPAWPHDAGPPEDSRGFGRSRWQVYSEARRNFDDGFDPRTRPDVMPAGRHGYKSRQRRLIWSSYDGGSRW